MIDSTIISTFTASTASFLILERDRPPAGLLQISSFSFTTEHGLRTTDHRAPRHSTKICSALAESSRTTARTPKQKTTKQKTNMKTKHTLAALSVAALTLTGTGFAAYGQEEPWRFGVTIPAWAPKIDGNVTVGGNQRDVN